ncbi:MucB/RseB C-terminal domain-containing protein [Paraneptunicella aestuarii]|nr:MucB/RseB C-terminal domain-containing protein [Paraneptunicella aestuarii]
MRVRTKIADIQIINRYVASLLLIASLVFTSLADARSDVSRTSGAAVVWLDKLRSSLHNLNYRITFVVTKPNGESEPYLWRHGVQDGIEMEHLSLLNGPGREAFRIGNKVSYFEPNGEPYSIRSNYINGPIPKQFFKPPELLQNAYDIVLVGKSRISGLPAQQIRIVSADGSRYSFTVWLAYDSGLLLKLDLLDMEGKLIEQIQVTSIHVSDEPDEYFTKIERDKLPEIASVHRHKGFSHQWKIDWLPKGMAIIKEDVHQLPMTGELVDYVLLSDGLVDVSVYMRELQGQLPESGWLRHESTTLLSLNNGTMEVTIVGKIPPKTANAIASSIKPVQLKNSRR